MQTQTTQAGKDQRLSADGRRIYRVSPKKISQCQNQWLRKWGTKENINY